MRILFFFPLLFIACTTDPYPDNRAIIESSVPENSNHKNIQAKSFKKDDHRYTPLYQNFDYDTHGYWSNDNLYYGYYDDRGYFYNNIYFQYDNRFTHQDRRVHGGYFSPDQQHVRVYEHYPNHSWNQQHQYRQPNQYVGEYPYYQSHPRPRFRVYHPGEPESSTLGAGSYRSLNYKNHIDNKKGEE